MKTNPRLVGCAIIAALGGFIFGFDTVVISGAEQKIESVWESTPFVHGLALSAALWGTVLGSLVGAYPADKFGRKSTLLCIGILYFVSAVWSGLATDVISFMIARFIGGVGVGISTVAGPLYITEISPPAVRGRLTAMYQFNIVFGILMAYLSNMAMLGISDNDWRWMLGVEAFPALAYTLACLGLLESPRWLAAVHGDRQGAADVLKRLGAGTDAEVESQLEAIESAAATESHHQSLLGAGLGKSILLTFLTAFFNQMSGINAVLYFAPRLYEYAGLAKSPAFLHSVGIGLANLVFTLLGIILIDKLGRRTLLLIGSVGYIASLSLCSWAFASQNSVVVPYCLIAFIAAHAVGQGAVIWVFIAEIFPNRHRAAGASLGSATHWVFAALVTLVFPMFLKEFSPAAVFAFFTGMMALQLVWVLTMVPETKGVPLEKLQRQLGLSAD